MTIKKRIKQLKVLNSSDIAQRTPIKIAISELQAEVANMKKEAIFREDWLIDGLIVADFLSLKLGPVIEGKTENGNFWYLRWANYTFGGNSDVFRVISTSTRKQGIHELDKLSKRQLYYVLLKRYLGENPRTKREVGNEKWFTIH